MSTKLPRSISEAKPARPADWDKTNELRREMETMLKQRLGLEASLLARRDRAMPEGSFALNSGEIDGLTSSRESFKSTWRKELDAGGC